MERFIPDSLYELAFAFKQSELWRKLWDTQIFGVKHSDGTIGYCCVMGQAGQHFALAVYPGEEGFFTLYKAGMASDPVFDFDFSETLELQLSQHCAMISFEDKEYMDPRQLKEVRSFCRRTGKSLRGSNAYPCFRSFLPFHEPWLMTDAQEKIYIEEALEAALEVSRRLETTDPEKIGLIDDDLLERDIPLLEKTQQGYAWQSIRLPRISYPEIFAMGSIGDELTLARMHKLKSNGCVWSTRIFLNTQSCAPEDEQVPEGQLPVKAPYYPFLMLVVDAGTGNVLGVGLTKGEADYSRRLTEFVLGLFTDEGIPRKILVEGNRAESFLREICKQLSIEMEREDEIEGLDEAVESYLDRLDEDDEDDDASQAEELYNALREPGAISAIPTQFLRQLATIAEEGCMPEDISALILKEIKRRNGKR